MILMPTRSNTPISSPTTPTNPAPAPEPPISEQLDQFYKDVEGLAHTLHDGLIHTPEETVLMAKVISVMGQSLMGEILQQTSEIPKMADQCREAAVAALACGMLAGAADAALLLTLHQLPAAENANPDQPATEKALLPIHLPSKEDIQKAAQEILAGLKDASQATLTVAGEAAKATGHLEVDKAGHFAEYADHLPLPLFKAYLAQTFLTGYGLGAIDSALESLKN